MNACPCGSARDYVECCEPVIRGERPAPTAEALMRARYTAHVRQEIEFIVATVHPDQRNKVDPQAVAAWSKGAEWRGLEILGTEAGGPEDVDGMVEFVARYAEGGVEQRHHEYARFQRVHGRWYFDMKRTTSPKQQPVVVGPKTGRNDPCPCGSGRKYKKCCGVPTG